MMMTDRQAVGGQTIKALQEVKDLLVGGPIYVRYSRSHEQDIERGYSVDHARGTREAGLSAQVIEPGDVAEGDGWLARLLCEYSGGAVGGAYGWLCRAQRSGTDSDGCPAITEVEYLATLDDQLVRRCRKYTMAYVARTKDWRTEGQGGPAWPQPHEYGI